MNLEVVKKHLINNARDWNPSATWLLLLIDIIEQKLCCRRTINKNT